MDGGREMNERRRIIYTESTNFKILSEKQMKNVFPTWENLYSNIENYRKWLKTAEFNRDRLIKEQYNLMYENVYSILGNRGSGKTSAIFTLKEKIAERNKNDIILPIVMPEVIPEGTETLGWVLASLEKVVNECTKRVQEQSEKGIFSSCHGEYTKLTSMYEEVKELCYSRQVSTGGKTISDDLFRNERRNQSGYEFSIKLTMFWEELVKVLKNEKGEEPLIYLIFDDVDLNPERALEICSTIVKYLSHPNLIIIVTADEELLYDVILDSMLRKMKGILEYEDLEKTNSHRNESEIFESRIRWSAKVAYNEKIRETASLYMSKVLPVSRRYPLCTYEECRQKGLFLLDKEKNETEIGKVESEENLESFLKRNIDEFIQVIGASKSELKNKNFLYYNNQFLKTYLIFFGNTARQITEAAFVFKKFMGKLKKLVGDIGKNASRERTVEEWVRKFISDTMEVRGIYWGDAFKINTIVNNLIISNNGNDIYINYKYLYSLTDAMIDSKFLSKTVYERRHIINYCVSLFMLSFFTENILKLMDPIAEQVGIIKRQKIHGHGYLVALLDHMLNLGKENESIVRREEDPGNLSRFIYAYGDVIENYWTFVELDRFKSSDVMSYCCSVNNNIILKKEERFKKIYRDNPKWFKTVIPMVWFLHRGVFAIDARFYNNYLKSFDSAFVYGKQYVNFLTRIKEALIGVIISEEVEDKCNNELVTELEKNQEELLKRYTKETKCTIKNCNKVKSKLENLVNTDVNYEINAIAGELLEKIEKLNTNEIEIDRTILDNLHKISYDLISKKDDDEIIFPSSLWYSKQEEMRVVIQITDILINVEFKKLDNSAVVELEDQYIQGIKKLAYSKMKEERKLLELSDDKSSEAFGKIRKELMSSEVRRVLKDAAENYIKYLAD